MTKEILDIEQDREDKKARSVIHLFKEGTFLRAYNWSAWLCSRYLHEFKVNKRRIKNIEEPVIYIGFPETSLNKWIPQNCEPIIDDDKHYTIQLMLDRMDLEENVMQTRYKEWVDAIPITEVQRKNKEQPVIDAGERPSKMTTIIQNIAAFPIESKSPIECLLFVVELKKQVAQLI